MYALSYKWWIIKRFSQNLRHTNQINGKIWTNEYILSWPSASDLHVQFLYFNLEKISGGGYFPDTRPFLKTTIKGQLLDQCQIIDLYLVAFG